MERFFEKITRALVENGNIREEEEEVYQYALKSMLILGGNILLSLMIGVCMGMPGYCVLFLCMLVPFFCILDFDNVLGKRDKCISTCHRISTCIGLIIINFSVCTFGQ